MARNFDQEYKDLLNITSTNMDELKAKLFYAFDRAFRNCDDKERIAMGAIAQALVAIDREQREAKERGYNKLDKN